MASLLKMKLSASGVRPAAAARPVVRVAASTRSTWLPESPVPSHLDGSMPGDYGFDPLGLGQSADRVKWYQEAEKTNGRWAMMAVAGIMGQELLGVTPAWYEAGAKEYDFPVIAQVPILFLVMGFLETKRFQGFKETGTSGFINSYPFDPAGMNSTTMAVKEIKNGRLAMIAFVGFAVQALATRTGPIEGLMKHMADPVGKNITYYVTHTPEVLAGTA
ncbi:hypothetical protein FOA52_003873 [Chlamydomonas sp. UWO 241]|nr:hypothetical protein FOA52_003873 [Chlamydomonas sp. UWO 241]